MHPAKKLYKDARDTARKELEAIRDEDMDLMDELSAQRINLLDKAWLAREGMDHEELLAELKTQQKLQDELTKTTEDSCEEIKSQLSTRKNQNVYFANAKYEVAMVEKSYLMNKIL